MAEPGNLQQEATIALPQQHTVRFALQTDVRTFETASSSPSASRAAIANQLVYETFSNEEVSDIMVADAAQLFSENYGIWGERSARPGKRSGVAFRVFSNVLNRGTCKDKCATTPRTVSASQCGQLLYSGSRKWLSRWRRFRLPLDAQQADSLLDYTTGRSQSLPRAGTCLWASDVTEKGH